ncbi:MAG TPA: hypothetical protein VN812_07195 [Candidatus Acidoferrales bacterium]|nr:hypothetical protein [Candidatus Acidoferrales bacterium]
MGQTAENGAARGNGTIIALRALADAIERRLAKRGVARPPDAFLLGSARVALIEALQQGLLEYVAAVHWPTFRRLARGLGAKGIDGLRGAVALSSPAALASGVTADVVDAPDRGNAARPQSVVFGRLTRPTRGHVVFRSQLLALVEADFRTTPLEMSGLLERHTPAAIRAMLHARLIKGRPDLDSDARQTLVTHATRHLGRLLSEAEAAQHTVLLLRVAYYRVHHPTAARHVLRRLRIVDFTARRAAALDNHGRPSG